MAYLGIGETADPEPPGDLGALLAMTKGGRSSVMMRWAGLSVVLMVVATTQASAEEAPRATASPIVVYMFEQGREDAKRCFRDLLISDRETYESCIYNVVWGAPGSSRRRAYIMGTDYEQFMEQSSNGRVNPYTAWRVAEEIKENFKGRISRFCVFFDTPDCDEFREFLLTNKAVASGLE